MEPNWGIIGHKEIVNFLQKSLKQNKLAQTYLFYGLEHLGKTTVAERFAEQLLGGSYQSTELYKLEVLEDKKDIGIDQVREWRRSLSFKAFSDQYKVGIIYGAEKLNRESANALLKTIEEPTRKTVLLIVTSNFKQLLLTVISRAQPIKFLPVPRIELRKALADIFSSQVSSKKLKEIERLAQGRPGLALKLLKDQYFFNEYSRYQDLVAKTLTGDLTVRWQILNELLEPLEDLRQKVQAALDFLGHLESGLRDSLLKFYQLDNLSNYLTKENLAKLSLNNLPQLFSLIKQSRANLLSNVQPRLVLENLLINL